jgi:hypothetical protein
MRLGWEVMTDRGHVDPSRTEAGGSSHSLAPTWKTEWDWVTVILVPAADGQGRKLDHFY